VRYRVRITPRASIDVGAIGLSRQGIVRVLAYLHGELPVRADEFRGERCVDDQDNFYYRIGLIDSGRSYTLAFAVNDTTAQGELHVLGCEHDSHESP
jgi:hypothetical protein